jgi:hydrogenase-4 component F
MISFYLILLFPLMGVLLMIGVDNAKNAGYCNIIITVASFIASVFMAYYFFQHGPFFAIGQQFYVDAFNLLIIILTTFMVMTTSFFSNVFMRDNVAIGRISDKHLRLYHVMYQLFAWTMLIALSANNIGILWVAMEGATLATVMLVSLYRTKGAIEASWKYFILCIVGIALALFGTVLVYFSATHELSQTGTGILWSVLAGHASHFDPLVIKIAFIFLLVGYGIKIGLVPLHNWLPDTYTESPAPVTALLSGLLSNVALYALIRFKVITDLTLANHLAGNLMMVFGLLSFIVAVVLLQRQNNIKRLFSYSSIEHMGLITFAFGLSGPIATFIGLFYMLVHSLIKSAIFVIIGNIIQKTGVLSLEKTRGLIKSQPRSGWGLLIATLIIAGIPPFGIFTSELMLFITCVKTFPLIAIILVVGLIMALAGLLRNVQPIVYGEPIEIIKAPICLTPAILHLSLVLVLGVYVPPTLYKLLQQATSIIASS